MSGMTEEVNLQGGLHLSIIQGSLRQKVDESTPGAVKREWTDKSTRAVSVKFEKIHKNLTGYITKMEFKQSDYGEQLILTLKKGEDKAIVYMPSDSRYFSDFAAKLPNIHLDELVTMNPYEMAIKGKDKKRRGISITQEGVKILSFFYDPKSKKPVNGIPEPKGDTSKFTSDNWKMFFLEQKLFFKEVVESVEVPVMEREDVDTEVEENDDMPDMDGDIDDLDI